MRGSGEAGDEAILYNEKYEFLYILTNVTNRVLYVGITSNLVKRIYEHQEKLIKGFSTKYNLNKLVYYEVFEDINEAIKREKQLKAGSREKKLNLIEKTNPLFVDLYPTLV